MVKPIDLSGLGYIEPYEVQLESHPPTISSTEATAKITINQSNKEPDAQGGGNLLAVSSVPSSIVISSAEFRRKIVIIGNSCGKTCLLM